MLEKIRQIKIENFESKKRLPSEFHFVGLFNYSINNTA